MRAPKTLAALCAALLFLAACAAPGQTPETSPAPAPEPPKPSPELEVLREIRDLLDKG